MSRETDSAHDLFVAQINHDQKMRVIDRLDELTAQGSKNLAVLNGGAVVAMLAFIQALVAKPMYSIFKPYGVAALTCFLMGALLATIAFFFQYKYIDHAFKGTGRQTTWRKVFWWFLVISALCAFGGGVFVTVGIYRTL
jgi:hypothetical protein